MIKLSLVCDSCGAIIAAEGISANEVRLEMDALYRRHDGKDLCPQCEAFLPPRRTHRRQKQIPLEGAGPARLGAVRARRVRSRKGRGARGRVQGLG